MGRNLFFSHNLTIYTDVCAKCKNLISTKSRYSITIVIFGGGINSFDFRPHDSWYTVGVTLTFRVAICFDLETRPLRGFPASRLILHTYLQDNRRYGILE